MYSYSAFFCWWSKKKKKLFVQNWRIFVNMLTEGFFFYPGKFRLQQFQIIRELSSVFSKVTFLTFVPVLYGALRETKRGKKSCYELFLIAWYILKKKTLLMQWFSTSCLASKSSVLPYIFTLGSTEKQCYISQFSLTTNSTPKWRLLNSGGEKWSITCIIRFAASYFLKKFLSSVQNISKFLINSFFDA